MTSPVTAADLAYARGLQESLLTEQGRVLSYEHASDPLGGFTEVWIDQAEEIPCFVEQLPEREGRGRAREIADQIQGRGAYILNLPYLTEIKQTDRFLMTKGLLAGRTLAVLSDFWGEKNTWSELRRVLVEEAAVLPSES